MTCEGHPAFLFEPFCVTFSGHTKTGSLQENPFSVHPPGRFRHTFLNAAPARPACRIALANATAARAPNAPRPWRRSCGWRPCG
ncbi:MAG TPA: hypothetical protein EYH47_11320 [Pseudomonas oleovorans]|nr:hypothetical protein [Pseudomonas oleovorans]